MAVLVGEEGMIRYVLPHASCVSYVLEHPLAYIQVTFSC